jgi:Zn-dependent protease
MDWRRWAAPLAILPKFTKLAKLTKLAKAFKAIKSVKLFLTLGTMAISAFVYSFMLGPWFSIGFVILLFVHEMGHIIAMRIKGIPASAPVFIPMLGAVIFSPKFKDRETEAFCGFGGPLLGSIGAALLFVLWAILPSHPQILLMLSYVGLFLNFFNLIPIRPFDGGRITQVAGEFFGIIGGLILLVLPIMLGDPSLLLLWIMVLLEMRMNHNIRLGAGVICAIAMISMMIAGYSPQPWWMDWMDCTLASVLLLFIWSERYRTQADLPAVLPPATFQSKIKWSSLYVGLGLAIWGLMLLHVPYLPEHVKKKAESEVTQGVKPDDALPQH